LGCVDYIKMRVKVEMWVITPPLNPTDSNGYHFYSNI